MVTSTFRIIRTGAHDPRFRTLVIELDRDLAVRDGDEHAFFDQYNKLDEIKHVVLVLDGHTSVGCGAFKPFDAATVEIKRMYTDPAYRKQGAGSLALRELEGWAFDLGYGRCVLETGIKQPEAIALYTRCGYERIPNYGQYHGVDSSVCFEKRMSA